MVQLNEELARQQKITQKQRDNLDELYKEMDNLFREELLEEKIEETGKDYARRMKNLEFKLQENWNFPQNELYHTWWNKFSNCICPTMDNNERFGQEKIINCACPIHKHLCATQITKKGLK